MQKPRYHDPLGAAEVTSVPIEAFLEISPLSAIILDSNLMVSAMNSAARSFFNYSGESLVGRRMVDCVRAAEAIEWLGEASDDAHGLCEFKCENGVNIWGEVHGRRFHDGRWLLLINDISERRLAEKSVLASEKQRWKVQRTEALEKLAGGIAHDFNNFLAVILLQTDMMNLQLPEGSPLAGRVEEIRAVSNDAASIVRQLLAFGRRQAMNPAPVVLNRVIELSERDFKALLGRNIELRLELEPDLGVCFVDQTQIGQALMYLAVNAREAMPEGGILTIRTKNIAEGEALIHKTQASGSYIQVEVIDTGVGMDAKTEDHIFEPFFSTKGSKKTTGLSLATVWGIVKQSGGYIWVSSVQNSGTSFKIHFPRVDQPKPATAPIPTHKIGQPIQTILLLDDESSVRKVAAEGLRQAGYRVLEAESGTNAIEIARTFPDPIHLILTDYSMPGISGVEAVTEIEKYHKTARVLFMTGDPANLPNAADLITKPFTLSKLISKVQETIGN